MDPEELGDFSLPPLEHSMDNWTDWENWEASPEIREHFPYCRVGYDKDGLVGKFLKSKN